MNFIRYVLIAASLVVCTAVMGQKNITQRNYWLDGNISNSKAVTPTIDLTGIEPGIHSFSMRVEDSDGIWSNPVTRYFIIPTIALERTKIVEEEYWLDGKMSDRKSLGASPTAISLETLNQGMHSLTMRIKDDSGTWSSPVTKYFIIPTLTAQPTEIVEQEYWIDGILATRSSLEPSPATIELAELGVGMHALTVRTKDDTGTWSSPVTKLFAIANDQTIEEVSLTGYLYWIDDDISKVKSGPLADDSNAITLDISDIEAGNHILSWCVCDSKGRWSKSFSLPFESTYTGIGSLTIDITSQIDGIVYDIQGQRMGDTSTTLIEDMQLTRGIYILNGKKIYVK
mgnify:CR=1 FL=1